jgi:hypothetical protein
MEPDDWDTVDTASDTSTAEADFCLLGTIKPVQIPWPPLMTAQVNMAPWNVPNKCTILSLPLRHMGMSSGPTHTILAQAACTRLPPHPTQQSRVFDIMTGYDIGRDNMSMIYMSPDPYFDSFEQPLDLRKCDIMKHPTRGLNLCKLNGQVYITSIEPGSPAAKMPNWRTRVHGAWLIKLGDIVFSTIEDVKKALSELQAKSASSTSYYLHTQKYGQISCTMAFLSFCPHRFQR